MNKDYRRKICVVTGSRADYGILHFLMKDIEKDLELELQVVVTGMHLSPEFGLTWQEIERDGLIINRKVEMLLSSDTSVGISKSVGLAIIGFSDVLEELKPDMVLILGDRYEIFAAAASALMSRIPIVHLHGGELTEVAIDDAIRHAITKMAHLHFVATDIYKQRVIQLGEQPDRVFNVGALSVENIGRIKLLNKLEFERSIDFLLGKKNLLVTFHPVTLDNVSSADQFQQLLNALDDLNDTHIIFTRPNSDHDGRIIIRLMDDYVAKNPKKSIAFTSLGQLRYFSAMQFVDAVIGNSSSGLIEVPSFGIGTINIGKRQQGRLTAESVISCDVTKVAISQAINRLFSIEFQQKLLSIKNPYEKKHTCSTIIHRLKTYPLGNILIKQFYDMRESDK